MHFMGVEAISLILDVLSIKAAEKGCPIFSLG